jgi:hypothetical protein
MSLVVAKVDELNPLLPSLLFIELGDNAKVDELNPLLPSLIFIDLGDNALF